MTKSKISSCNKWKLTPSVKHDEIIDVLHAFIWSKVSPFSYLSKYAIRKHYSFMSSEARTNTAWPQNWSLKMELHRPPTEWRHWGSPLRKRTLISLLVLMFLIISVNKTYRANLVAPYRQFFTRIPIKLTRSLYDAPFRSYQEKLGSDSKFTC